MGVCLWSRGFKQKAYRIWICGQVNGFGIPWLRCGGVDFLRCGDRFNGDIITNPPYKYAKQFVEHGLDLINDGNKVFMFLKIQFLEGKERRKLFDTGQLKTVYVSSSRILCAKNGDFEGMIRGGGSAVAHAWYEFQKGYKGETIVKWIN